MEAEWLIAGGVVAVVVLLAVVLIKRLRSGSSTSGNSKPQGTSTKAAITPTGDAAAKKGPPMTILYASQSGTAEAFAFELGKEAKQYRFNAKVIDIQDYDHENDLANEKFVVFLMATFGEGDPTDSAVNFYDWVKSDDRRSDDLENVEFAMFGLGNRQYEHFCAMAARVSKHLKRMGATEILPHGEGDDDGSLEDDYSDWKSRFWDIARKKYLGEDEAAAVLETRFEPSFTLTWVDEPPKNFTPVPSEDGDGKENGKPEITVPSVLIDPKHNGDFALCIDNYELRQEGKSASTRHIILDVGGLRSLKYRTADNLGVMPRNSFKLVGKLAKRLGVDLKRSFRMKSKDGKRKLAMPIVCTVHDALLWYCDITSIPKRTVLEALMGYATDPADKAKLLDWISNGKAQYHEDCKNFVEVLEEVPSVIPPFGDFIEFIPKLQPRFYTISSSSKKHPTHIHLTVAVTTVPKPRGRTQEGVCSTYLASLRPNKDKVAVFVRTSSFTPAWDMRGLREKDNGRHPPMIMVGPGTGVAPFRAFLQEASHLKEAGATLGDIMLFFGCQRSDHDFLYKDEFEEHQRHDLAKIVLAFSRETHQKVYVQHRMEEHGEYLWNAIANRHAVIYICGGTGMGRGVREAIIKIMVKHGGLTEHDAAERVKVMQNTGRFVQELWS